MLRQQGKWFGGEFGGQTSFVCSAKLSKRLPLWSNAKHCAECPPLATQNIYGLKTTFGTARKFGRVDEDAAVYFDFWSGSHTEKPMSVHAALWQSLHDVNGPFHTSCSVTRATNALGLAGVVSFEHVESTRPGWLFNSWIIHTTCIQELTAVIIVWIVSAKCVLPGQAPVVLCTTDFPPLPVDHNVVWLCSLSTYVYQSPTARMQNLRR